MAMMEFLSQSGRLISNLLTWDKRINLLTPGLSQQFTHQLYVIYEHEIKQSDWSITTGHSPVE